MILGIDHVGIATDDPAGAGTFMSALGLHRTEDGIAEAYGVACEFWQHDDGAQQPAVELVSSVRAGSPVEGRLARSGPGLYHIAFAVDDIESESARLQRHGLVAIDSRPCAGARKGMRVAFMYVPRPAGLLVELVQYESG